MQAKKRPESGGQPEAAKRAAAKPRATAKRAAAKPRATARPKPAAPAPAAPAVVVARGDSSIEKVIFSSIAKIAAERNVERLMPLLADFGRDLVDADRCTVWLCDERAGILWSKVGHGIPTIRIQKTQGIAGWVATHGLPLITNDPYRDDRFDQDVDKRSGYHTRSILALPILDVDGRVTGVYQALNKRAGGFTEKDREHLLLAATYTAEVLKTAQMQEEIEATQREIILTMAEAGELRSKETGQHVKRVSEYCRLLGERFGLPASQVEDLRLTSPMHDIGKIAIPDAVLLKPAKLDEAEWKIMKSHSALGHDMLKHSERRLLKAAAIIAWQHHEKWDGTGYPCRIAGAFDEANRCEGIHVYARITAIADVFDALGSNRPYKRAWDLERIVALFAEESGKHFDPALAKLFLDGVGDFWKIRETYQDEIETAPQPPSACPDPARP